MSKIVCNSVEFVLKVEIDKMNPGEAPILKDGKEWKKINVAEKPVYQSNIKQNDAGPTNEETVIVKLKHNEKTESLPYLYTILRMSTDKEVFYIGNLEYPCSFEKTSDKIFDNYTFKAVSPA